MIKKVLILIPNARWSGIRQYNTHPYAACLIAATIKDKYEVEIMDTNLKNYSLDETIDRIKKSSPDLIAFSTMSIEYCQSSHKLTALIKKEFPEKTVVMGGAYCTLLPEVAFKDENIDYLVLAEGEIRFPALLDALNKGLDTDQMDGIASRKNGVPIINTPGGFEADLDSLPFPAYELINYEDYSTKHTQYSLYNNPKYLPYGVIITSRGCPFKCTFCSTKDINGKKVRNRSAENVLKEIDWLVKDYGIRELLFLDDNLFLDRERIKAIMNGLIERNYDLHWKAINVPTFSLNDELMALMKKSGCYQVSLPIESGNGHVLKNIIKKPLNLKKANEVVELAKKYEFETIACFVIGFPGETWDQIQDSVAFADRIDVDWVVFNIASPLPNTELYEECKEEGYLEPGFDYSDFEFFGYGHGSITTEDFTPIELQTVRAYEWDRINFKTQAKKEKIAAMNSISLEQLHDWRVSTRRNIGVNVDYAINKDGEIPSKI